MLYNSDKFSLLSGQYTSLTTKYIILSLSRDIFIDFRETEMEGVGGGREKERDVRETSSCCLPYVPQWGIEPTTWVCFQHFGVQGDTPAY